MDHMYIEEMNDGKGTNFHLYCSSHLQFIAWMNLLTSSASVKSQQHHLTFEPLKSKAIDHFWSEENNSAVDFICSVAFVLAE